MSCRDNDRKPDPDLCNNQSQSRVHCKNKFPEPPTGCQCAQTFDNSFPYNDLPPPAPPDGRADLWELQFCRWWGWNWVKKRESLMRCESRNVAKCDPTKSYRPRDNTIDEIPVKLPACAKPKKGCISYKEPELKVPHCQNNISPKEQFKAMCKCLIGKKKTPSEMAKLYNTPSTSRVGLKLQDRAFCGMGERSTKPYKHREPSCYDRTKIEKTTCRDKSRGRESPRRTSLNSATSATDSTPCESLFTKKPECSTEESIEYLTFKLAKITSDACPCQKVGTQSIQNHPEPRCGTTSKNTQTCFAFMDNYNIPMGKSAYGTNEKLVKIKGKKHKTICIMVCCCGSCKSNDSSTNNDITHTCTKTGTTCPCKACPKVSCTRLNEHPQPKAKEIEEAVFPFTVGSLNTNKALSKFGTPSKSYPWLEAADDSTATTISLNNIGVDTNSFYDWLNTGTKSKLPEFMNVSDNLSLFPKLTKSINKSNFEDRVLLDAVCDAILQEHEDNQHSRFLEDLQFGLVQDSTAKSSRDLMDIGVQSYGPKPKADVYTELSKALVNTEEVGTQLAKHITTTNQMIDQPEVRNLDNMMDSIMKSIFLDSQENIKSATQNKDTGETFTKSKCMSLNQKFTKSGLLPSQPFHSCTKPAAKRAATNLQKSDGGGAKKLRTDDSNSENYSNDNVGNIFSKIDDIVRKSKVKTAEIQKVLNLKPDKNPTPEPFKFKGLESVNNNLKKNYPMSSDNFKGSILYQSDISSKVDFKPQSQLLETQPIASTNSKDDVEEVEVELQNAIKDSGLLHDKLSKLSVHSFVVCDQKPSGVKGGKKQYKRKIGSKGSLIPIRK